MGDSEKVEKPAGSCERLGPCEVCGCTEAKYTCPRCEVKTCCLACVNIHKKELECDGARNKILFKPLSKFQNLDLLSDYRLLEDVTRSVQQIQRDPIKGGARFLPGYLQHLGRASRDRGMRLHFLPRRFQRARENSSRVIPCTPERLIYWRIEWLFPQAGVRLISDKVAETTRLVEALSPLLDPNSDETKDHREQLQYYFSAGTSGVCALMRVGEMEKHRYHLLDLDATIRGNLVRKSVVEFPSILIVLKDHKYSFDIYDSDAETEQWRGNWERDNTDCHEVKPKIRKNPAHTRNFFAGSDCSSDEGS
ncbi:hypothetical protein ONE63_005889 [Megalurothrips usitatus]|uniref:HIT-type domain-containing protein n=1 Tax=Megalurothrips usitatus TaxID=439358 RepID=A0AAV7Y0E7_9NEOP|nr:hypothetical protein ONE63_005889 [Megalurothrips usitatus]